MAWFSGTPRHVRRRVIILDTNVVSAIMLAQPDPVVLNWLNRQPSESIWLTSVTMFEIRFGLLKMPAGRKVRQRAEAFERIYEDDINGRILSFDPTAALFAAEFAAKRRVAGRPVEFRDVEIAGIAAARSATLATRNVRDFEGFSIDIVNPWTV
jgi:toxin FitB